MPACEAQHPLEMNMKTSNQKIRVVKATSDNVPRVVELMRGLAEYEKMLDQFLVTEELLIRHLFTGEPAAELLVGYIGDEIQGYALFYQNFSTFLGRPGIYLEDIYVEPSARGKGLGKALLLEVIRTTLERGCQRCDWMVLDWNEQAIQFYESLGAKLLGDWRLCRMEADAMKELLAYDQQEK